MSRVLDLWAGMTGTVLDFAGTDAPAGWIMCYGQAINRTTYSNLFDAIGTTYGVGDGSTTFNVPDVRGRVTAGKDNMGGSAASRLTNAGSGVTGTTLGAAGGAETHTLTTAQMPSHSHGVTDPGHTHLTGQQAGVRNDVSNISVVSVVAHSNATTDIKTTGITVNNNGSGNAHPVTQPTFVLNKIIKT